MDSILFQLFQFNFKQVVVKIHLNENMKQILLIKAKSYFKRDEFPATNLKTKGFTSSRPAR